MAIDLSGRDVLKLKRLGESLSMGAIAALDKRNEITIEDRFKAIGKYESLVDILVANPSIYKHLSPIIEQFPKTTGLIHCHALSLLADNHTNQKLCKAWMGHLSSSSIDPNILTNAASFFIVRDYDLAINLCKDALKLEPKNNRALFLILRAYRQKSLSADGPRTKSFQQMYRYAVQFEELMDNPQHSQDVCADIALIAYQAKYYDQVFYYFSKVNELSEKLADYQLNESNLQKVRTTYKPTSEKLGVEAKVANTLIDSENVELPNHMHASKLFQYYNYEVTAF